MNTTADPVTMATFEATDALQTCTEACSEWQKETARFVDRRLTENRRSLVALMAVRDVPGLMRVQQQWGLQMAADYMNEAGRLARLFTSLSLTGNTPAVQDATRLLG